MQNPSLSINDTSDGYKQRRNASLNKRIDEGIVN